MCASSVHLRITTTEKNRTVWKIALLLTQPGIVAVTSSDWSGPASRWTWPTSPTSAKTVWERRPWWSSTGFSGARRTGRRWARRSTSSPRGRCLRWTVATTARAPTPSTWPSLSWRQTSNTSSVRSDWRKYPSWDTGLTNQIRFALFGLVLFLEALRLI